MSINTIADLLEEFVAVESEMLNSHDIKHPVTVGAMFEGLTEDILQKSIFSELDLKVVKNSFIKGCESEFDVMLVEGEAEQIPYTERYRYPIDQVLVVIQVKKNLFSKDISDGYNNLKNIYKDTDTPEEEDYHKRLFRDAFRGICRKDIYNDSYNELNENEKQIYYTLNYEALLPIRIIWGYNGFKSEHTFREAFYKYLSENISTSTDNIIRGYGVLSFPNQIICGKYSFVKINGMPFGYPIEDDWWYFYASTPVLSIYYFLELLWTRLSYKYKRLPTEIFGDDLEVNEMFNFLSGKAKKVNDAHGWEYKYHKTTKKELGKGVGVKEWMPVEIDVKQYSIINEIGQNGAVEIDSELEKYVIEGDLYNSIDDFIFKLTETGLVYIENNKLKLLTDNCQCAFLPNGKIVAADNKSGRLTNWINQQMNN